MTIPPSVLRRVERLEQSNTALRELTDVEGARASRRGDKRWVYLAKTIRVSADYPTTGDTFGFSFIDRDFTVSEGPQAVTDTPRSDVYQGIGHSIDGSYIGENTVVAVIPAPAPPGSSPGDNQRWHIIPPSIPFQIYLGKAVGPIPQNTTGAVERFTGGAETDAGLEDSVINKWPDIPNNGWVIYATIGSAMYVIAPSGGASTPQGIPAVNRSGFTIPPHGVLFIPDSEIIAGSIYLSAYQVTGEFDHVFFINGASPVAPDATFVGHWLTDQTGPAAIVQGVDPLTNIGWGATPGSFELSPYMPGGFLLLNKASRMVGGQRVSDFIQSPLRTVFGKLTTDIDLTQFPAGDVSAKMKIWHRGEDKKLRVSPWDPIDVYPFWLNKKEFAKAGTKCRADLNGDFWEADFACDVDDTDSAQAAPAVQQQQVLAPQAAPTAPSSVVSQSALSSGTSPTPGAF